MWIYNYSKYRLAEAVSTDPSVYSNTYAHVCTSIQPSESISCMFGAGSSSVTVTFVNSHTIQIKIFENYFGLKKYHLKIMST